MPGAHLCSKPFRDEVDISATPFRRVMAASSSAPKRITAPFDVIALQGHQFWTPGPRIVAKGNEGAVAWSPGIIGLDRDAAQSDGNVFELGSVADVWAD